MSAAERVTNDVVDLLFAAGAHAARALDARVEVDRHRRMRQGGGRLRTGGEARLANAEGALPVRKLRVGPVGLGRHVAREHFDNHFLRVQRARAVARHLHSRAGTTATGRSEHALSLDLDHARAAVAVPPHPGPVAEPGNRDAAATGALAGPTSSTRAQRPPGELSAQ